MTIGQDHCFSTFLSKFGLVIGVVCWGISHLSSLYTAAWFPPPPDFVCLLSLCKHSFTSLSGSAMEKHVHVAFLIQLHFSCRCSFSAFYIQILCIWKLLATQWLQKQLPTTIVKYQNKGGQNQLFVLNSDISELCFPFCTDKSSLLICIKLITPLWSHVVAKPNEKIQWWVLLFMSNVICALSSGGFQ